jgi:hypothetical protein
MAKPSDATNQGDIPPARKDRNRWLLCKRREKRVTPNPKDQDEEATIEHTVQIQETPLSHEDWATGDHYSM